MVAEDDILRGEIEGIKERTIVDDIPFVFGVQEDCYGYYTKEGTFKPF